MIPRLTPDRSAPALLVAACLLLDGCARAPVPRGSPSPTAAARETARRALGREVRESLRREDLAAWYPRAVDHQSGGFLSQFEADWTPSGAQDKMIVTQARHVWMNARAAQLFHEDTTYRASAAQGYHFLRDRMWDREAGGFFWLVTRDGRPKPELGGRFVKQAYGNAFGIYALAAYYDVTRDSSALALARDAFQWLDAHAHDPVHGGYFNYLERDGTPLRAGLGRDTPKDQNSSIHILEAFTELYRVWPDPVLRDRLAEMLHLIRDVIVVAPGTLTLFSTEDWRPVSYRDSSESVRQSDRYYHDHVSFGHDVETAYLMLEAAEALGSAGDSATRRVGKQMLDHALRTGWDSIAGGFYDAGYYHRGPSAGPITIVQDTKNWWAQAEGLNTLLVYADMYPDDPMRYYERFLQQWAYIKSNLIDHERGGWYQGGLDKEPASRNAQKGQIWKAMYHDGRAMMNVSRRLLGEGSKR